MATRSCDFRFVLRNGISVRLIGPIRQVHYVAAPWASDGRL